MSLQTACHSLTDGFPGNWATEWGEDRFGIFTGFRVGMARQRLRWVPAGTFMMGSPMREMGRFDDEGPRHEVTISGGYWLAETPCTQALWVAVMGENPSEFKGTDRPVEGVSWEDCQRFLKRINDMVPELGARLPTEAKWERACRAGTTHATWVGELNLERDGVRAPVLDVIAWYHDNWKKTHPVAKKQPNPYGIYDMLGNVREWCEDWYASYDAAHGVDPLGPATGSYRVARGGSWYDYARQVRAASRFASAPSHRFGYLGFRIACSQPPTR